MFSTIPDKRSIAFPGDRSLGELYTSDENGRAELLGEATGVVEVPAGRQLALYYSFDPAFGLAPLARLAADDLQCISFLGSDIRDSELSAISGLTGLREIDLSCTAVGNGGVKFLSSLRHLVKLNLSSTRITDQGLSSIAALDSLEELVLDDTRVGDEGAALISGLSLKVLSMSFTSITNKGLKSIKEMKSLERLRLNCTRIDDAGLSHVARLRALKELWVRSTDVSYPGLVELTKWLSDCEIIR